MPAKKNEESHIDKGHWRITYHFDGKYEFYDVKARKKMEFNGTSLPDWQETHHQYLVEAEMLHIWEKIGTEWKQVPLQKTTSRLLPLELNPRWWSWPRSGQFSRLIQTFKPIDVKRIDSDEGIRYHLTLRRMVPNRTTTLDIWLDPENSYHPIRIYEKMHESLHVSETRADGTTTQPQLEDFHRLTRFTYQLAKFEPDIWFPKTVTRETSLRKTTLQVHRAVFNTPIAGEDLPIHRDE